MAKITAEKACASCCVNGPVVVTMDGETAGVLRFVLSHVGGSPEGPRGLMAALSDALDRAGVAMPMNIDAIRHMGKVGTYIEDAR
ncbi:hypothetical protein [Rhizobium phage RHph_X2_26]|nr:hypothetical protein [Rhizobium phage RHph_X2_26]